jgi:hypothetical protein
MVTVNRATVLRYARPSLVLALALFAALATVRCDPCPTCSGASPSPTSSPPPPTVTPTATPTPSLLVAAGSTGAGVDCSRQLGYVALLNLGAVSGSDGEVQVLDLSKDPGAADARIETIDLGHADFPSGIAVDIPDGRVFVVSGGNGHGGFIDIINETTIPPSLAGSAIAFPAGADTAGVGQAVFDQGRSKVIVATVDDASCASAGTCTGFSVFDIATSTFGPVVKTVFNSPNIVDSFALDPIANTIIAPNDDLDPFNAGAIEGLDAVQNVESGGPASCTLSDSNFLSMLDPDGASADLTTELFVTGDLFGTAAGIFNLNGATFGAGAGCSVTEGGTSPNSALVDLGGMPGGGVAVNPMTHQALISGAFTNDLALLTLPAAPAAQLGAIGAPVVTTAPATDPLGNGTEFAARPVPYATTVDVCNNLGYVSALDAGEIGFLMQVDLTLLQSTPGGISTALPAGNCPGTSTTVACDNGAGVKFYPTGVIH